MSTLGAFCMSPLGAFVESALHARGCAAPAVCSMQVRIANFADVDGVGAFYPVLNGDWTLTDNGTAWFYEWDTGAGHHSITIPSIAAGEAVMRCEGPANVATAFIYPAAGTWIECDGGALSPPDAGVFSGVWATTGNPLEWSSATLTVLSVCNCV